MTRKKTVQAFSLVELSIVILVIGILVAAVAKGSKLYRDIKLTAARSVTSSSVVNSIPGLALWLETTSTNSVSNNNNSAIEFGDYVASWNDIRIVGNSQKINLTQDIANNDQPIYVEDGISGLPSLRFDGINDRLLTTNTPLRAGDDDYTLVAVWKAQNKSQISKVIMSQDNVAIGTMASIYIRNTSNVGFAGYFCDKDSNITLKNGEIDRKNITIISIDNSLTENVSIYFNSNLADSGISNVGSCAGGQDLNLSDAEFDIASGAKGRQFFGGDISEIIIFDRKLTDKEIRSVNDYLSQKFSIKIN